MKMSEDTTLYDKAGNTFAFDHEANGAVYVRPMIRVLTQTQSYSGDDFQEHEELEPAPYLILMGREDLFDVPPIKVVNAEIATAQAKIAHIKAEAEREKRHINAEKTAVERALSAAKRQLDEWMLKHRPMIELGKLMDGQVLYPLSVSENPYHRAPDVPTIPKNTSIAGLKVFSGSFQKGQAWRCERYLSDGYGKPFRFYDTEAERDAVILSEFDAACSLFRKRPNFETTQHTSSTKLHYGTLERWVEAFPSLCIPADIVAAKAENDTKNFEARRAKLSEELAMLGAANDPR